MLNALDFGLPQKRERVIIVGLTDKADYDSFNFDFTPKKEETAKLKESYDAGVTETIGAFIKAAGLKWKSEPSAETLGQQFRMSWDTNKNLSNELESKEGIISSKDVEIRELRAKVITLTEEVNGLKYRLTLIDENAVERLRNAKNAETYTSLGGSNGFADQLTNWDGTKKLGLGTPVKKKRQSY